MALPSASYCVSTCIRTMLLPTLPAFCQLLAEPLAASPPPSVVKLMVGRPAPSYWVLDTSPPGSDVFITSPRRLYQVLVVRLGPERETAPVDWFTLNTCVR